MRSCQNTVLVLLCRVHQGSLIHMYTFALLAHLIHVRPYGSLWALPTPIRCLYRCAPLTRARSESGLTQLRCAPLRMQLKAIATLWRALRVAEVSKGWPCGVQRIAVQSRVVDTDKKTMTHCLCETTSNLEGFPYLCVCVCRTAPSVCTARKARAKGRRREGGVACGDCIQY